MPTDVASNRWSTLTYYDDWRTLELKWHPSTRDMDDDGTKQTLELLATEGERLRPTSMIVDATEFFHDFGESVLAWRNENVVPRYNAAGVTKFAFLVSEGFPGTVEAGGVPAPDGPADFPTGWFSTRERAYEWLAS